MDFDLDKKKLEADKICFINRMKTRALEKIMGQFFYDKWMDEPIDIADAFWIHKEDYLKWAEKRSSKSRYKYVMFTINPYKDDVDLLKKKIEKCVCKNWITKYMYCFEQRGKMDKDLGKGIHIHLKVWLKEGKNVYRCRGEVYNTFKSCVQTAKHINVRYSNRDGCFDDYIQGWKTINGEKIRKDKWDDDCKWRYEHCLHNLYESNAGTDEDAN